ncbi:Na+/H+ antiporter NhaA [Desulfonema ishimotonii]|uniref:Na(+)/H(+) antiporter NhaA n=1 Tax=Desulfonema ishimotonii TaxID=45657 RepID=A0A401FS39_9BACT|nr:Na+/H+ antiporter NhaA [Desulfonema ishimotonii]GBC59776.1 Na+/H+ antiporter NhaA [Desulfonema ishimotonii]
MNSASDHSDHQAFPPETTGKNKLFQPSQWFFSSKVFSSVLLLFTSLSAVYWANSFLAETYQHFFHTELSVFLGKYRISHSLVHWINDGLMTLFFFTVGLEIKREILVGELASVKKAMFPVIAALGGMVVPAAIYLAFTWGTPAARGWGVPMATDIAFSLGAIALFGKRLPTGLRVFLAAFAIADDLGAVLVIAIFYTQDISWYYIIAGGHMILGLGLANFLGIRWLPVYLVLGFGTWVAAMGSGVHPTIAGVIVALLIPAQGKYNTRRFVNRVRSIVNNFDCSAAQPCDHKHAILLNPDQLNAVHSLELACHNAETPLQRLEHALHPWVAYAILPLFAFANAGLTFHGMTVSGAAAHPVTLGIVLGLFIGKPVGVTAFSFAAVRSGLAALPEGVRWPHILGAAMLGGIGFTMSLFISGLAFTTDDMLNYSKLGTLAGSVVSIIAGIAFLSVYNARQKKTQGR